MKIPKALKARICRTICNPAVGRTIAMAFRDRIPHKGFRIETSHESIDPWTKAALFWGNYESSEIRFVNRYLNRDIDIVELGCSIGVLSCHIRRLMDVSRQLICVEAFSDLAEIARLNLAINGFSDNVTVIEGAIDYDKGQEFIELKAGERSTGGHIGSPEGQKDQRTVQTRTTTLSEIARRLGNREYGLISDIEGAEAGFILGAENALAGCRQIIIELHRTTHRDKAVTVEELIWSLTSVHGFVMRDRYGSCCVFENKTSY